jgi:preprotein translocase subunit SecE
MKKTTQKRKKKGTRKKNNTISKPNIVSNLDDRPIPSEKENKKKTYQPIHKKESEVRAEGKGSIFKYVNIMGQFLRESKMELKKVKWPTRKELLASTAMVIFLVIVVALFLGLIDFGLIKIIKNIIG